MTALAVILLLGALAVVIALVRDVRRDPARRAPSSHNDDFAPRWSDAGAGRWSL